MTAPARAGSPEAPNGGTPPATEADYDAEKSAKPDRGQADDGKTGGQSQGGILGQQSVSGGGAGDNAQRGAPSGSESERIAPGMSTDKKADDTK